VYECHNIKTIPHELTRGSPVDDQLFVVARKQARRRVDAAAAYFLKTFARRSRRLVAITLPAVDGLLPKCTQKRSGDLHQRADMIVTRLGVFLITYARCRGSPDLAFHEEIKPGRSVGDVGPFSLRVLAWNRSPPIPDGAGHREDDRLRPCLPAEASTRRSCGGVLRCRSAGLSRKNERFFVIFQILYIESSRVCFRKDLI